MDLTDYTTKALAGMDAGALLNPDDYERSVFAFLKHFSLVRQSPDLNFLSDILLKFSNLPYENVSKIIKLETSAEKIRLPDEVMEDHQAFNFGGTCFALTFFLETILKHLGFICYPVTADMKWRPNSHCALIVLHEGGKYLVDPGYLLNRPLLMLPEKPRVYHTDVTGVELVYRPDEMTYELFTFNKDQMKWRYRFMDIPCSREDILYYWVDSFHWNSMHGLCLTRVEKGRMVYIHRNYMQETTFHEKKKRTIKSDYHETIHQVFGICPEKVEEALEAIKINMTRERDLGIFEPRAMQS